MYSNNKKSGAGKFIGEVFSIAFAALLVIFISSAARAQTANVYGALSNFDVINHTGHHGHGFEIELEGIHPEDVYYSFSAQRYGAAHISATANGTLVRWESAYANGAFAQTTLPHEPNTPFAGSCYQWGANYNQSACEHFGVSLTASPTHTSYRWLIEDEANPGTLLAVDPPLAIVSPVYIIVPPARDGDAPELAAEIEAPEAAEGPELYGDAQWVKVLKTQLNREVNLDELVTDNAVIQNAQTEVEWEIIQAEPVSHSNGNRRQRRHQAALNFDTRSVVRRFETYAFTGAYDPLTHEAICADVTCTAPAADELGEFISAQMAAANVQVNSVSVTKRGSGTVASSDRTIDCGSKCGAAYNAGQNVTLTATPARDFIFSGWNGACSGGAITCLVNVQNASNVIANFTQTFEISVKTSGKGAVNSPSGISCGKNCSIKVASGTNVTLTATPESGFRFTGWSGSCTGAAAICTTNVNKVTAVTANFAKN